MAHPGSGLLALLGATALTAGAIGTAHPVLETRAATAVTLSGQGRYVEFTLPASANSIVVRSSIPDSPNGAPYTARQSL
jgi:hypothetical protein